MTGKIALIVAFVGMASATGKPEERRNYKPKEIETGKEYPLAPLSELISIKRPETIVLAKVEITEKQRQDFEKKFRETAPRFDVAIVALPQVMDFPSTPYINQHGKDRPYFALYFDKNTSDKTSIYYTGNGLPSRGEKIDTADVFEAYARDCYLKAFDSTPIGELESAGNGGNLKVSHGESAFWKVLIEGVSMKKTSSVRIALEGNEQWSLSCNKGPTAEEVKALTEHLRSQPTRVTDQEAVATAWKNWKAVRPANYSDDVDFITGEAKRK